MNNTVILERENKILKEQQAESIRLLTACKSWVGTHLGEHIAQHLAAIGGRRHNVAEWNMADVNGEQGR